MTDTARTLDEMRALLVSNTNGSISAQDVRDLMQSVAAPLPGQGFLGSPGRQAFSSALCFAGGEVVEAHPTTYGPSKCLPFGANQSGTQTLTGRSLLDPTYSLDAADPASTYGVDVDAGNAFMLEPGVWLCTSLLVGGPFSWPGAGFPAVQTVFDQTEFDTSFSGATDGSEPFMYYDFWNPLDVYQHVPQVQFASTSYSQLRTTWLNINDTDVPQPFALFAYTLPGWTVNITLSHYAAVLWKVA